MAGKHTILFTDDDPTMRTAMERIPFGSDISLVFASLADAFTTTGNFAAVIAGDAALLWPGEKPAMIELKEKFGCPVMLLSLSGNRRLEGYAKQNGADVVLFKPFALAELRRQLYRLLGDTVSSAHAVGSTNPAVSAVEKSPVDLGGMLAGEAVFDALFTEIERRQPLQEDMDAFDVVEKGLIKRALMACDGNQSHAARFLGITRNTLRKRIRKYGFSGLLEGGSTEPDDEP